MKKKVLCALILLLFAVLLCGCTEVTTLRFKEESYTVQVGDRWEPELKVIPKKSEVSLYSSNTECVEVNGTELVAKAAGVARITAVSGTKSCELTVYVLSGKSTDVEQPVITDPSYITFNLINYAEAQKESETIKTLVTSKDVDITNTFPTLVGYSITWYTDRECTVPIGKTVYATEGNTTFYGVAKVLPNPYLLDEQNRIVGITYPNLVHAYMYLPEEQNGITITGVADEAFMGDTSLVEVWLPSGYTSIGKFAFAGCINLVTVRAETGLKDIGAYAFSSSYKLEEGETVLNEDPCAKLATFDIPDTVESIGACAFYQCSSLVMEKIPSSLKKIEKLAFSETKISKMDCSNVTYIGEYAFYKCADLTTVIHTEKVTECGGYAFSETPIYETQEEKGNVVYVDTMLVGCYRYLGYFLGNGKIYLKSNTTLIGDYALNSKYLVDLTVYFPKDANVKIGYKSFYVQEYDDKENPVFSDTLYLAVAQGEKESYQANCPQYKNRFYEKIEVEVKGDSSTVNFGTHTLLKFSAISYVYDKFTPGKVQEKYVLPTEIDLSLLSCGRYITAVSTGAFSLKEYSSREGTLKTIRLCNVGSLGYSAISGCPDLEVIDISSCKEITFDNALSIQFSDFENCILLTKYSSYEELKNSWATTYKTASNHLRYVCSVTLVTSENTETKTVYAPITDLKSADLEGTWYLDAQKTTPVDINTIVGENITLYQ